jgi:hypothetical protein
MAEPFLLHFLRQPHVVKTALPLHSDIRDIALLQNRISAALTRFSAVPIQALP